MSYALAILAKDEPLAQLAEHLPFKQGVPRSSRGWLTSKKQTAYGSHS